MPRQPEIPGQPAKNRVQILLTDADLADLDAARGEVPVSAYARNLLRAGLRTVRTEDHSAAHAHVKGRMLSSYTVKGKTTTTYACTRKGCTFEFAERS